jgi:hypothetical protein
MHGISSEGVQSFSTIQPQKTGRPIAQLNRAVFISMA